MDLKVDFSFREDLRMRVYLHPMNHEQTLEHS
jgi:hypothetical protein